MYQMNTLVSRSSPRLGVGTLEVWKLTLLSLLCTSILPAPPPTSVPYANRALSPFLLHYSAPLRPYNLTSASPELTHNLTRMLLSVLNAESSSLATAATHATQRALTHSASCRSFLHSPIARPLRHHQPTEQHATLGAYICGIHTSFGSCKCSPHGPLAAPMAVTVRPPICARRQPA